MFHCQPLAIPSPLRSAEAPPKPGWTSCPTQLVCPHFLRPEDISGHRLLAILKGFRELRQITFCPDTVYMGKLSLREGKKGVPGHTGRA